MATMPVIDDNMVDLFRRTGRRRARYSAQRRGVAVGRGRVMPQRSPDCVSFGVACRCNPATGHCAGICDQNLNCINNPFPGGDQFRL